MDETVTTQKLKEDLAAVMRDAEALLNASAAHGGEKMEAARAKIRESLDSAKARVRDAEQRARQHGEAAVHATEDYAKQHPWQALGIAAGVGLIVGVLLARR
jgi:ElaB/YqjD/DUF883 family membrane-anchored ribosome-binding protein